MVNEPNSVGGDQNHQVFCEAAVILQRVQKVYYTFQNQGQLLNSLTTTTKGNYGKLAAPQPGEKACPGGTTRTCAARPPTLS